MDRAIAACILLLGIGPLALADNPSPEQLIRQLADKNFKVRQAAAKAIQALGPAALPALRKAKDHPDPEVRRRIALWIPKFELAAVVAPKQVTLNLTNQALGKAIDELARQTGYKIDFDRQDRRAQNLCTIHLQNVTFWEGLDQVCRQAESVASLESEMAKVLLLSFAEEAPPHVTYHRAFRIAAKGFVYHKNSSIWR
jgi:hypothetical protein